MSYMLVNLTHSKHYLNQLSVKKIQIKCQELANEQDLLGI